MIRLLGALLLLLGGLALGLIPVGELSNRVKTLESWIDALLLMEGELAFSLPAMPQLLDALSAKALSPAGETFTRVRKGLEELGERTFSHRNQCFWNQ